MKSKLILVDGISGSGKGGRSKDLAEFLRKTTPYKVHLFREPHYFREEIKRLRGQPNFDKKKCLDLFIRSRKRLLEDYKLLLEAEDNICILDRGFLSTLVIQQLEGFDLGDLIKMHDFYPIPDLALVLSCNPEVALERILERNKELGEPVSPNENHESLRNQISLYSKLGERFNFVRNIDASGRVEAINLVVQSHVKKLLGISMSKAIFLDKDGTLVENSGYPEKIPTDEIYEFSYAGLRGSQEKGYKLFIVSSQPWVARGRMTSEEVKAVFESVKAKYAARGINIVGYGYCIHARDENCPDKKPSTQLFEQMAQEHNIDLTSSYVAGDSDADIKSGINLGLKTVLVRTGSGKKYKGVKPNYILEDIGQLGSILD